MKRIISSVVIGSVMLGFASPALAVTLGQEIRKEVRQEIKEEQQERAGSRPGLVKKFFERAAIGTGRVTAINGTTLTVEKDGKSYTVTTTDKTQFRRRFWGKGSLAEIAVGHTVNVIGKWTDDAKTTVEARLVRDVSIQKRHGVFFGKVESVTTDGWVMTTISDKRENQAVKVTNVTKFTNRKGEALTQTDVKVGHRVRVRGLWDRSDNTVTEVSQVKDFDLPVRVTPVPTVTSGPTP